MSRVNPLENINIRVGLEDMDILRKQAAEEGCQCQLFAGKKLQRI